MSDRLKAWLRLKSAPDMGFQAALKLLQNFSDPAKWNRDILQQAFQQKFIVKTAYDWLSSASDPENWKNICSLTEKYGIKYTTLLDNDYPYLLKTIYSSPPVLYYRGSLSNALQDWNLGVVGTRKPTEYGKAATMDIVEPLARAKITIISGLAFGIDACAHRAALRAKGKTIAVLAHGLETVYPPQNHELAEKIAATGALVSEYEPGSKMERWNFPARNRIISGLSHGVMVCEGSLTSGALLTAKFALEQNRDIYALPGQINIVNAQGPNYLIKTGAKLVSTAEDILQDFGIDLKPPEQTDLFPELNSNEQQVYDLFKAEQRNISFDEIILKTGFSVGQLSIVLLNLELKGLTRKAESNSYMLR